VASPKFTEFSREKLTPAHPPSRASGTRGRERAQTAATSAATAGASASSQDSLRTDTARSPGKKRLYIISRRATGHLRAGGGALPAAPSPQRPSRSAGPRRAGAVAGRRQGAERDTRDSQTPAAPHQATGGGCPGPPRAAQGGRCGARPPRAPLWARVPEFPGAPRGSAGDRSSTHLPRALPEWLCGIASSARPPTWCGRDCARARAGAVPERRRRRRRTGGRAGRRGGRAAARRAAAGAVGAGARSRADAGSCGETP
jgi:hypothetical protein